VLTRVFVRRPAARAGTMHKRLWRLATEVLPRGSDAWVMNQAMMDLGATVCTARIPHCTQCCLQPICHAAPSFSSQLTLFPSPYTIQADLPLAAEADAPPYGGGTPPPRFGPRAGSRKGSKMPP
jgi:adenine-specific DNA glycosylase